MKKILIYSVMIILFMSCNNAIAIDTIQDKNAGVLKGAEIVYDNSLIKIVKKDGKFGVFDIKSQTYFIKPVLEEITKLSNNDYEYKIKSKDMLGYTNLLEKIAFLSYFDDISVLNSKYLTVKKDEMVGITDKKGKVLVPLEYKKVAETKYSGTEYFIAKSDGRYDVYYSDGRVMSKSNISAAEQLAQKISIIKDLNPALKEYRLAQKKNLTDNKYIIEPENNENVALVPGTNIEEFDTVELETEIGELPVPITVRGQAGDIPNRYEDKTSIIASNYPEEEQPEIEVEAVSMPSNVKLSVRHEDYVQLNEIDRSNDEIKVITLNDRPYIITKNNGKYGIQTSHGREVIPARYKALKVKKLDKDSHEIIAAIDTRNTKLYDTNGDILAKRFHNKVDVYTSMRKYEYSKDSNGIYKVDFNGRKVGEIELYDDGTYLYTRTGFNLSNMNKANELFITLIEAEQN